MGLKTQSAEVQTNDSAYGSQTKRGRKKKDFLTKCNLRAGMNFSSFLCFAFDNYTKSLNIFYTELQICTFNLSPQAPLLFLTGNNKHTSSFNVPLEKCLNTNIYRCLPCLYASSQMLVLNPNFFPVISCSWGPCKADWALAGAWGLCCWQEWAGPRWRVASRSLLSL